MAKTLKILANGGASSPRHKNVFEKRFLDLSGKRRPHVLLIPTATGDPQGRIEEFHRKFKQLGCTSDDLQLVAQRPSQKDMRDKIKGADLIYVSGGNTQV